ncbi:MAG: homoserine dehydrogenase [Candidatus Methanomethylophilaceae archaeon]|nr:homoserine dehydrogenase [Candidatus Methanomethylophilaceae archaeon]
MIVNAELYVKDMPGQLVGSLDPISLVDGNILGVVHNREQIVNHRICINITFEVEDRDQLCRLRDIWKSKDIVISKLNSVYQTYLMDYLLIGDFDSSFIEDALNEASKTIALEATDIRYTSKAESQAKRTAMISIKTHNPDDMSAMDTFLSGKCAESGITYVRGV